MVVPEKVGSKESATRELLLIKIMIAREIFVALLFVAIKPLIDGLVSPDSCRVGIDKECFLSFGTLRCAVHISKGHPPISRRP